MPVDDSRLSGFYKYSVEERRDIVAKLAELSGEDISALAKSCLLYTSDAADE